MATESISQAGLQGLRDGVARAQDAATRIARAGSGSVEDIAEAVVDLKSAELQTKASAQVVETANRTVGSLIDILV